MKLIIDLNDKNTVNDMVVAYLDSIGIDINKTKSTTINRGHVVQNRDTGELYYKEFIITVER